MTLSHLLGPVVGLAALIGCSGDSATSSVPAQTQQIYQRNSAVLRSFSPPDSSTVVRQTDMRRHGITFEANIPISSKIPVHGGVKHPFRFYGIAKDGTFFGLDSKGHAAPNGDTHFRNATFTCDYFPNGPDPDDDQINFTYGLVAPQILPPGTYTGEMILDNVLGSTTFTVFETNKEAIAYHLMQFEKQKIDVKETER